MAEYMIQKHTGSGNIDPNSTNKYEWVLAYGLTKRSYPVAKDDSEATAIFKNTTRLVRTGSFRLMRFCGGGYGVSLQLVSTVNCEPLKKAA